MIINRQFLDVQAPPSGGLIFPGGALPRGTTREERFGGTFPVFEEVFADKIIPRNEWQDLIESLGGDGGSVANWVRKIKDQDGEGTCVSNACAQGFEVCRNLGMGFDRWMEMSPISLYRFVAGGPGSGSTLSANLKQMRDVGLLPVANDRNRKLLREAGLNEKHVLDAVGYYQRDAGIGWPNRDGEWRETAKYFRIVETFDIDSFEGFVSALLHGFPVVYARSSHCILGVWPVLDGRSWVIKYANSWGRWGEEGYGFDSEAYINRTRAAYGAFACRTALYDDCFFTAV